MKPLAPAYLDRFGGLARLYGRAALRKLHDAHVAVVGVGGVGSWSVEALARSGLGTLTLIDLDDVCITNTNRQLPAVTQQIGRPKVQVLAERIAEINPDCQVHCRIEFFTANSADSLLAPAYDFLIDAIDRTPLKALLIARCRDRGTPVLTVGGSGGRRDATRVQCGDLNATGGDVLLRSVRRELRKEHGWPAAENGQLSGVPAIYSSEPQVFPWANGEVCETREPDSNLRMDCASGYGAACFVTGTFGFAAAGEVVRRICA